MTMQTASDSPEISAIPKKSATPEPAAIDATFDISFDADRVYAYLNVYAAQNGGKALTRDEVLVELIRLKIRHEKIDEAAIDLSIQMGSADSILIAAGRPAVDGQPTQFIPLVENMPTRVPKIEADGTVNFRDMGEIHSVSPGDLLIRRIPATDGRNGETLIGGIIKAKAVRDDGFAKGLKGVEPCPEDRNILRATITGQPVIVEAGVYVDEVFVIKNVNMQSGNVVFDGAVKITGDVSAGMTVRATGNIVVEGTVEGALLESGGDILIKAGFICGTQQTAAKDKEKFVPGIKCQGSAFVRFAQSSRIEAGVGIYIDDYAIQCDLFAEREIILGKNGKGLILNGNCRAKHLIKAKILGANSGVRTVLRVGPEPEQLEEYTRLCDALHGWEKKFVVINSFFEKVPNASQEKAQEIIARARTTLGVVTKALNETRQQRDVLKKDMDILMKAQIMVSDKIFPGTELCFAQKKIQFTSESLGDTYVVGETVKSGKNKR